jgi:hypothetical protein
VATARKDLFTLKTKTMKNKIAHVALSVATLFTALGAASCEKKETKEPTATDKKWIVTYRDVMLGNQKNYSLGHFFKSKTGEVIPVEQAQGQQKSLSMVMFTEYGDGVILTFPGNAYDASTFKSEIPDNRLFAQNPGGMNHWSPGNLNSGEVTLASYDGTINKMTLAEFNTLSASGDWSSFESAFKLYNGGESDLSYVANYVLGPGNGDIYLIQLNNSVRAIIYIKNVVPSSANGGSIKFDIIIEGSDAYAKNPDAEPLQPPGKD